MRSRVHAMGFPSETGEFAEEIRDIFPEIGLAEALIGECSPSIDVYETDETLIVKPS